ncbi:MAG: M20/M25/M40 family metallo-hydrolase, partial [Acidobacteriota bacterium]|nr:M20/M25/M40 family metallo-hydrolase [Acidobacteriota bacterium]
MKRLVPLFLFASFAYALYLPVQHSSKAQQTQASSKLNPQIEKIVSEISAKNIEAGIRKLVSFGTRHTLSSQDDPVRGIGAARRWIKEEMDRYSRESSGRLIVTEDEFMQPPSQRVPKEAKLVNIVATLPGTQAESKDRLYVVSGHYDSICSPGSDITCDAPGASDDASGTAAVMEMARVMSKYQFDATIIFMTVPGEEQGLLGAAHWAEEAKKKNLNIAAMFTNDIIGNTFGGNGVRDNRRVRVFSEGVPTTETEAEARTRQSSGGENDGPSRQLARYIKEIGERYVNYFEVTLVFRRDRYGRGGDHNAFLQRGFTAVRFTEPNEDFTRQHQKVREENGIKYGDVFEMA